MQQVMGPELLKDFMHRFYGYGSWNAKVWFVGMEEGGGDTKEEIERRLRAWDRTDELADLKEYLQEVGGTPWFAERPRIQSTWGKLIRVALAARGQPGDREAVRQYQRDELGRRNGETALVELLPLPSPSTTHWLYSSLEIESIKTRARYRESITPVRVAAIRERIGRHRPHVVVFYGTMCRDEWTQIAQTPFTSLDSHYFETASNGVTTFIMTQHPGRVRNNSHFDSIGKWIAANCRAGIS